MSSDRPSHSLNPSGCMSWPRIGRGLCFRGFRSSQPRNNRSYYDDYMELDDRFRERPLPLPSTDRVGLSHAYGSSPGLHATGAAPLQTTISESQWMAPSGRTQDREDLTYFLHIQRTRPAELERVFSAMIERRVEERRDSERQMHHDERRSGATQPIQNTRYGPSTTMDNRGRAHGSIRSTAPKIASERTIVGPALAPRYRQSSRRPEGRRGPPAWATRLFGAQIFSGPVQEPGQRMRAPSPRTTSTVQEELGGVPPVPIFDPDIGSALVVTDERVAGQDLPQQTGEEVSEPEEDSETAAGRPRVQIRPDAPAPTGQ